MKFAFLTPFMELRTKKLAFFLKTVYTHYHKINPAKDFLFEKLIGFKGV
ncbi:MAG: hypothetical protein ACJBCI_00930 [Candidatus Tisiphia sp.]